MHLLSGGNGVPPPLFRLYIHLVCPTTDTLAQSAELPELPCQMGYVCMYVWASRCLVRRSQLILPYHGTDAQGNSGVRLLVENHEPGH